MKIIEYGNDPDKVERRWTCRNCKSIIESALSEGSVTYDQRDGNYVTFDCPVCKTKNHISLKVFKNKQEN